MADTIVSSIPSIKNTADGILMNVVLAVIFLALVAGVIMLFLNTTFNFDSQQLDAANGSVTVPESTTTQ